MPTAADIEPHWRQRLETAGEGGGGGGNVFVCDSYKGVSRFRSFVHQFGDHDDFVVGPEMVACFLSPFRDFISQVSPERKELYVE